MVQINPKVENLIDLLEDSQSQKILSLKSIDFVIYGYLLNAKLQSLMPETFKKRINSYNKDEIYTIYKTLLKNNFDNRTFFLNSIDNLINHGFISEEKNILVPIKQNDGTQQLVTQILKYTLQNRINIDEIFNSHDYDNSKPTDTIKTLLLFSNYSNNILDISEYMELDEEIVETHIDKLKNQDLIELKIDNSKDEQKYSVTQKGESLIKNLIYKIIDYVVNDFSDKVTINKNDLKSFGNFYYGNSTPDIDIVKYFLFQKKSITIFDLMSDGTLESNKFSKVLKIVRDNGYASIDNANKIGNAFIYYPTEKLYKEMQARGIEKIN
jgi:DNA-binding MarR family transcriptional regulator